MPDLVTKSAATLRPKKRRPAGGLHDPASCTTYFFRAFSVDLVLIGRRGDCDVIVEAQSVSRRHAILKIMSDGRALLRDHKSRNGTYVNGDKLVGAIELVTGMVIHLGSEALLLITDKKGEIPITAYNINEYCHLAKACYGSGNRAASRILKSRQFIVSHAKKWLKGPQGQEKDGK